MAGYTYFTPMYLEPTSVAYTLCVCVCVPLKLYISLKYLVRVRDQVCEHTAHLAFSLLGASSMYLCANTIS